LRNHPYRTLLVALVLILAATRAQAQYQGHPISAMDGRWHFLAGLYGWFPAIEGTVSTRNFSDVPVDVSFEELWDHLKFDITGHFEARRDRFGLGVDFMYVHLAVPVEGPIGEFVNASVNMRQIIGEGFLFYRVVHGPAGFPWTLDLTGAARVWNVNTRIESDVTDRDGKTTTFVDGVGGLRVRIPLGSRFALLGQGDVGAGEAKLDWSASGDIAFFAGCWVLGGGYRSLNIEYDKGPDFSMQEPPTRRLVDLGYNGPRVWIAYTW
jgi:hypothetical protein